MSVLQTISEQNEILEFKDYKLRSTRKIQAADVFCVACTADPNHVFKCLMPTFKKQEISHFKSWVPSFCYKTR